MRLYHGTDLLSAKDICVNGIDLSKSRKHIDFGRGFYLTDDYFTAKKWAKHKALQRNSDPAIINVDFDFVSAKKHIKFFNDDIYWAQFVINNRNGYEYFKDLQNKDNNLDGKYDITCGRMADLNIASVAFDLSLTKQPIEMVNEILNENYSLQYAFHTSFSKSFIVINRYTKL